MPEQSIREFRVTLTGARDGVDANDMEVALYNAGYKFGDVTVVEERRAEGPVATFEQEQEMSAMESRPQDPNLDGAGWTYENLEHGGDEPDTMPNAIRATDRDGVSLIYVPIGQQREALAAAVATEREGSEE